MEIEIVYAPRTNMMKRILFCCMQHARCVQIIIIIIKTATKHMAGGSELYADVPLYPEPAPAPAQCALSQR